MRGFEYRNFHFPFPDRVRSVVLSNRASWSSRSLIDGRGQSSKTIPPFLLGLKSFRASGSFTISAVGIRESAKLVLPKPLLPCIKRGIEGSHWGGYVKSTKSLLNVGRGTGGGGAILPKFDSIAFFRRQISLAPLGWLLITFIASETDPFSAVVKASCQKFVG